MNKNHLFSRKTIVYLIIPLIIEQLLAVTVGMADTIMVARVGESGVSAVSLVDSINILLINIFAALATGGAVVAGQHIGRNKLEKANKAGEQLILFVTIVSIVIMFFMYIGRNFLLDTLFGSIEPRVRQYANTYMMIVFASIPFIAIYNSGAALFRTMGNSKVSMITSLIMNTINVIGNAILIYGAGMGVEGVAIPTLVSRAVAAIVIVLLLRNEKLVIHLSKPFKYSLDKTLIKDILQIGVPNGIENSMFQLGKVMLLSVVATFGTASITANAVASNVTAFQFLPGTAIGLGLVTIISQCVGAKEFEEARYYTRLLIKYTYIAILLVNIVIIISTPFILKMYNLSSETMALAKKIIISYGINSSIAWPLGFTLPNSLRAAKDVRYTMIVSVGCMWIVRIGLGILFARYLGFGMFGVWMGMFCDWYVRAVFYVLRYRGDKWQLKSII